MKTNRDITTMQADEIVVGHILIDPSCNEAGVVTSIGVHPDDRAGHSLVTFITTDAEFDNEITVYEYDEVQVARLTVDEIDAIIAGHEAECPWKHPEQCVTCEILWGARSDARAVEV